MKTFTYTNFELTEEENNSLKQAILMFSDMVDDTVFDEVDLLDYLGHGRTRVIDQDEINKAKKQINESMDKLVAVKGLKQKFGLE